MTTGPYVALAHARLVTWLGIDPARGGVGRSIERHVHERLMALGHPSLVTFAALLDAQNSSEARSLVAAATVPHSWLFRDAPQLEALVRRLAVLTGRKRTARVWIAGCAGGDEAYSVAALAHLAGVPVKILATDVNETALARARRATFDAWSAREVPPRARALFHEEAGQFIASDALRGAVRFGYHSLVSAPPLAPAAEGPGANAEQPGWDAIVCRNVLIYFSADIAIGLVRTMARGLAQDGALVLGASDVLAELPEDLVVSPELGRMVLSKDSAAARKKSVAPPPNDARARARGSPVGAPLRDEARAPAPHAASSVPMTPSPSAPSQKPTEDPFAVLARGDSDAASALALGRLAADPRDAEAALLAGLALHARADYAGAALRLRQAAELAPGAWVAWFYLALVHERQGHWDEARRAYARVGTAQGEGMNFPRGDSDIAATLHSSRKRLLDVATRRELELGRSFGRDRRVK